MKIVVNDTAASFGGAMTVLKSFYQFVRDNDAHNQYIFLLSGPYLEETDNIRVIRLDRVKKSPLHKLWFDFISGKKLLRKLNPDRVISLQNIITFGYNGQQWVYVHQSIPFQTEKKFSFLKAGEQDLAVYQYIIGAIIKLSIMRADRVFVQTDWMRRNISSQCRKPESEIRVIPIDLRCPAENKPYLCDGRHFFYPTTNEEPYKNHRLIYEAINILESQSTEKFSVRLTLPENQAHKRPSLEFCGRLTRAELDEVYSHSVLLFPSFIETVGLPLVEAMNVGALILAADCEYAHESLAGYSNAYFFDPFDANSLAALMKKSINGQITSDGNPQKTMFGKSPWSLMVDR